VRPLIREAANIGGRGPRRFIERPPVDQTWRRLETADEPQLALRSVGVVLALIVRGCALSRNQVRCFQLFRLISMLLGC
jgi:hypothetical protein